MTHTTDELREILLKATPGPWEDRDHWSDDEMREVAPTYDGPPEIGIWTEIAAVSGHGKDCQTQAWANARLIAAAPDLAAEVIRLREALSEKGADGLPALAAISAPEDTAGALIRVRQIALQSAVAPLAMGEIIKRVDLALGEETPLPAWIIETAAAEFAALAEEDRQAALGAKGGAA